MFNLNLPSFRLYFFRYSSHEPHSLYKGGSCPTLPQLSAVEHSGCFDNNCILFTEKRMSTDITGKLNLNFIFQGKFPKRFLPLEEEREELM